MSNLTQFPPTRSSTTMDLAVSPNTRSSRNKRLAAILLAAAVSAMLVLADNLVESYAEGDFLVIWLVLWAVGFAALALFADVARKASGRLLAFWGGWAQRREQHRSDTYLRHLAARNPRIMAELQAAMEHAQAEQAALEDANGRRWLSRQPAGTFNAGYQGPRNGFRTSPLAGLPTHLQYLPN